MRSWQQAGDRGEGNCGRAAGEFPTIRGIRTRAPSSKSSTCFVLDKNRLTRRGAACGGQLGVYLRDYRRSTGRTGANSFDLSCPAGMTLDSTQLNAALAHHQAGRFEEAQQGYLALRAEHPADATLLSLLGAVNINLRHYQVAADYLSEALAVDPNHQAAHDNLGVLLGKVGRYAEAAESFRRAVALNPDNAQTQLNLGAALARADQSEGAIEAYRAAARLDPNLIRAHAELAKLLLAEGRAIEAVPALRQLARLKPGDPKTQFELAAVLAQAGQTAEAIGAYQEVLRLKPDSAESCVNLAQLHIAKRDYTAGELWARKALSLRPEFAEAHLNLASALTNLKRSTEAKTALFEVIRLKPKMAQAYNNLGIVLSDEADFEASIAAYRQSLALEANNADTIYNLGLARFKQGQPEAALAEFDRAISIRPNYAEAHHNRASAQLLLGDWQAGFAEYEWRFRSRDFPPFRPRWKPFNGQSPEGRTIVLVAEQGLGDTLQFIRYARILADEGATVIVECPKVLHPILAQTQGVSAWISGADAPPEADGCIPLLSMPLRAGTTLDKVRQKFLMFSPTSSDSPLGASGWRCWATCGWASSGRATPKHPAMRSARFRWPATSLWPKCRRTAGQPAKRSRHGTT